MKVAVSRHIFALLECVGYARGIVTHTYKDKIFKETAKWEIRRHVDFLSLVELRRVTGLFVNSDFMKAA